MYACFTFYALTCKTFSLLLNYQGVTDIDRIKIAKTYIVNKTFAIANFTKNKLEIWGKAQRESAQRPKSDWGINFEG